MNPNAKEAGVPDRESLIESIGVEFLVMLRAEAAAAGVSLADDLEGVAAYAAGRADHLSALVGDPGFGEAVIAERDSIAMKAALGSVASADDVDGRVLAVIRGGIQMAARALAVFAAA